MKQRPNLLILVIFISSFVFAQNTVLEQLKQAPSYEEVLEHFCDRYAGDYFSSEDGSMLKFAFKPTGWFVYEFGYYDSAVHWEKTLWQNGEYRSLDLEESDGENLEKRLADFKRYQRPIDFRRHVFFGYDTWPQDVIDITEPLKYSLNTDQLYSLARAYSTLCTDYCSHQWNAYSKPQVTFKPGGNCISSNDVREIDRLTKKAIYYFNKVAMMDPNYCVVVGRINTKRDNEYMTQFTNLWPLKSIEFAADGIPEELYTEDLISTAKNYLGSCPPNAILITNGDNDTYPLYYLQAKQNFRTDVTVINMSLIAMPRFRDASTRGFGDNTVKYSWPESTYKKIPYKSLSGPLDRSDDLFQMTFEETLLTRDFYFKRGSNRFIPKLNKSYVSQSDFACYDIIHSNPNRPIVFSQENNAKIIGLDRYTQFNGFTYTLTKTEDVRSNPKQYLNFLENTLELKGFDNSANFSRCTSYQSTDSTWSSTGFVIEGLYGVLLTELAYLIREDEVKRSTLSALRQHIARIESSTFFEMDLKLQSYLETLDKDLNEMD